MPPPDGHLHSWEIRDMVRTQINAAYAELAEARASLSRLGILLEQMDAVVRTIAPHGVGFPGTPGYEDGPE